MLTLVKQKNSLVLIASEKDKTLWNLRYNVDRSYLYMNKIRISSFKTINNVSPTHFILDVHLKILKKIK